MVDVIREWAQEFLDATYLMDGTDEQKVEEILAQIQRGDLQEEFEKQVLDLLELKEGGVVQAILADELSGIDFRRSFDIYYFGEPVQRAGVGESFLAGLGDTFDFSTTGSKAALGLGTVLGAGLIFYFGAPAVAALVVTGLVVGGVGLVKNGIEIMASDSPEEAAQQVREIGSAFAGTLLATLPLIPSRGAVFTQGAEILRTAFTTRTLPPTVVRPPFLGHPDFAPPPPRLSQRQIAADLDRLVEGAIRRANQTPKQPAKNLVSDRKDLLSPCSFLSLKNETRPSDNQIAGGLG